MCMMAEEEKKVSFGFSKTIKKSTLQIPPKQEEKKVDYIECLDEKAIRIVGGEDGESKELVIPMLGSKTWCDRILSKTDTSEPETRRNASQENCRIIDVSGIKKEASDETENSSTKLERQAVDEIIQDLRSKEIKVENENLVVPIGEEEMLHGKQESTLEDYEQIPVDGFGLAVLRGMGWKPGRGIGKNEKLFAPTLPELRPRGMGLGAGKPTVRKPTNETKSKTEEQLKVEKGSFVKVGTGKYKGNYGRIEGFDDGAGRLIVKMALGGESLSLTENIVEPVTKAEFEKNSKLLNNAKFEEYMKKTRRLQNGENLEIYEKSDGERSGNERVTHNRRVENNENASIRKKKKKVSKYSSDGSNNDSDDRTKKRRRSSSRETDHHRRRRKKSKKSKHSDRGDGSTERLKKKHKRKDKEMEKKERRPNDR